MLYWLQQLQQKRWEYSNTRSAGRRESWSCPTLAHPPTGLVGKDNGMEEWKVNQFNTCWRCRGWALTGFDVRRRILMWRSCSLPFPVMTRDNLLCFLFKNVLWVCVMVCQYKYYILVFNCECLQAPRITDTANSKCVNTQRLHTEVLPSLMSRYFFISWLGHSEMSPNWHFPSGFKNIINCDLFLHNEWNLNLTRHRSGDTSNNVPFDWLCVSEYQMRSSATSWATAWRPCATTSPWRWRRMAGLWWGSRRPGGTLLHPQTPLTSPSETSVQNSGE